MENEFCRVYVAPSMTETAKIAVIASRKVGKAVIRNKCRRWFKELYQNCLVKPKNVDMIFVAKPSMTRYSFLHLKTGLEKLIASV